MDRSVTVSLGGQEFEVHRARLGQYLRIQEAVSRLHDASTEGDNRSIVDALLAFFQVTIPDLTRDQLVENNWIVIATAFASIQALNALDINFALFKFADESGLPVPWEYPERMRYYWVHLIASAYHWHIERIEDLWPEDAIAFLQEIIAQEQYEREFVHSLSEVAYQFDQASKKSRYKPLLRPAWMIARDPKQLITKLPRALMPVGNVVLPEDEVVH